MEDRSEGLSKRLPTWHDLNFELLIVRHGLCLEVSQPFLLFLLLLKLVLQALRVLGTSLLALKLKAN